MSFAKASISAEDTFTAGVLSKGGYDGEKDMGISISGTFSATVTIQRSLDGDVDANYKDLSPQFTGLEELNIIPTRNAHYRIGVKAGDYTSGTVEVEVLS